MPELSQLSALAFIDYVRIKHVLEHDHKLPTEAVAQHDSDPIEYHDLYNYGKMITNQLQKYSDDWYSYNSDLMSALITLLYQKHIITKQEMADIPKIAIQLLHQRESEERKDKQNGKQ